MKKKILISLTLLSLLFTGCNNNSSSSNSFIDDSLTDNEIVETLNKMKEGNFTLEYSLSNNVYKDVITKNYYYIGYLNNGSMLLDTYSDTKYAYDYQIKSDDSIELKGQTFNDEQTSQKLTNIDFINKMAKLDTSNITFSDYEDNFITTDESVIEALSSQIDFSSGIKRAIFYKVNNNFTFELQAYDSAKLEFYTPEGGIVNVKNIGDSKIDSVEKFLSNWKKPTITLENKANNIFGNVSFETSIVDYTLDNNVMFYEGNVNLDLYNDYIRVTTINENDIPYQQTYKKNSDDSLTLIGVNGKNEVVNQTTTKRYSDFALVGKENFELDKFRKINENDNYYLYLGDNAQQLAYSITQSNIFSRFKCLKIQVEVENDIVKNIYFFTGIMQDRDTGDFFYYRLDTKVLSTPNVLSDSTKKTPSKDDAEIKTYLNKINAEDASYSIDVDDSAWEGNRKTKIIKSNNIYLKGTYEVREDQLTLEKDGEGYYKKNDKVYSFTFDRNNNVKLNPSPLNKTLLDAINFTISSEILSKKDNELRTTGDIVNIGDSLGFISNPDFIDPSSLKMTIDNNSISTIFYKYGGSGFSGDETLTFNYDSHEVNNTLVNNLDDAIKNISSKLTWKDDGSETNYNTLIEILGSEEIVQKVPYLPDSKYTGEVGFVIDKDYESEENVAMIYSMCSDTEYNNNYIAKFKEYLLTLNYVTSDNVTYTNENDNLKIVVGNTMDDFLHISLINI